MRIAEIFQSIQGEGKLSGIPSTFIRVSGCNLRCAWCDTPYASWNPEGEEMPVAAIADVVAAYPAKHVVLTGGEPMVAKAIRELASALRGAGYHITIETAGTVPPEGIACDLASLGLDGCGDCALVLHQTGCLASRLAVQQPLACPVRYHEHTAPALAQRRGRRRCPKTSSPSDSDATLGVTETLTGGPCKDRVPHIRIALLLRDVLRTLPEDLGTGNTEDPFGRRVHRDDRPRGPECHDGVRRGLEDRCGILRRLSGFALTPHEQTDLLANQDVQRIGGHNDEPDTFERLGADPRRKRQLTHHIVRRENPNRRDR